MKKSELFMQEMLETFKCHPYAEAPRRSGEGVYLSDVYGSYSDAKEYGYNYCRKLCDRFNGRGFKIVSHNCQAFTIKYARKYISDHSHYGIRGHLFEKLKITVLLFGSQRQTLKQNASIPIYGHCND